MTETPGRSVLAPGRLRLLLLALLLFFGGTALAAGTVRERAIDVTLLVLVIVAAVTELRERGGTRVVAVGLAASAIILSVVSLTARIQHMPVVASGIMALLAGLVVYRVYSGIMRPQRPVGDRIVGAISVFLLLGLAWAKLYQTLEGVAPGSFHFPPNAAEGPESLPSYTYLSFVTLATLGYGDVTPVTPVAQTLAWLEAVTGQLYLAITVARLVALSLRDSPPSRD